MQQPFSVLNIHSILFNFLLYLRVLIGSIITNY